MSVVALVSGGLDSTLVAYLAKEEGIQQHPLFVDYGQISKDRELAACRRAMSSLGLDGPTVADLSGFGQLIRSGLTDPSMAIVDDAFTPGRNMLFLLVGAAHAYKVGANAVSVGLLHEDTALFPDQTSAFLTQAEAMLSACMGRGIRILAPLASFHKVDVVRLAKEKGIDGTYSCHAGGQEPCGVCIACREFRFGEA